MKSKYWLLFLLPGLMAFMSSCSKQRFKIKEKVKVIKVDLPKDHIVPKARATISAKYMDGNFTVSGAMKAGKKRLGKQIKLKGYVKSLYPPADKICPPCKKPHFYLVDKLESPAGAQKLLVVYLSMEEVKLLKESDLVEVTGLFRLHSITGFSRSDGLLDLLKLKGPNYTIDHLNPENTTSLPTEKDVGKKPRPAPKKR